MSDQPIKPAGVPLSPIAVEAAAIITPAVIADAIADARRSSPKLAALLMAQSINKAKRK
jgi:hypothetical protein